MTLDFATRIICQMEREEKVREGCEMCGEPVQEDEEFCKMCGYNAE